MIETTGETRYQDETGDRWVDAGTWAVGLFAAVASWAGWVGLAGLCGWTDSWSLGLARVYLSWLLPLSVDIYALIGFRVWLRSDAVGETTRDFARRSTLAAIGLGIGGNAGYHLMVSFGWETAPWPVVVLVSSLPPVMLGAVAHLSALRKRDAAQRAVSKLSAQLADKTETETAKPVETETAKPVETETAKPVETETIPVETETVTQSRKPRSRSQSTDEECLQTIRDSYPKWRTEPVSYAEIKSACGIRGQETVKRLRQALYPNGAPKPVSPAKQAATIAPTIQLPVPAPRALSVARVNGETHSSVGGAA